MFSVDLSVRECGGLIDAFRVHPSVAEAADEARRSQPQDRETSTAAVTAALLAGSPDIHQPSSATAAITRQEPP